MAHPRRLNAFGCTAREYKRFIRDFVFIGFFFCCLEVVCLMDHLRNSVRQRAEKDRRLESVSFASYVRKSKNTNTEKEREREVVTRLLTRYKHSNQTLKDVGEGVPTPSIIASRSAMVSGLSGLLLLVNQWIIWNMSGSKSLRATFSTSVAK